LLAGGLQDAGDQGLRVRVQRVLKDRRVLADLNDAAKVHDEDSVGDGPDQPEVMRDEDVRHVVGILQPDEQPEYLHLDGEIQRGDGLIAHDERWAHRQGTGDRHSLTLAAAQFMRIPVGQHRFQTDFLEQPSDSGA